MEIYKCGYCGYVLGLGKSLEAASKYFALHSCLAVFEHVVVDENTREVFGYTTANGNQAEGSLTEHSTEVINQNDGNFTDTETTVSVSEKETQENTTDKWSHEEIQLLISTYEEQHHKISSPRYNKKQVWGKISDTLRQNNVFKSAVKCDEKWRNLKKQYEKVLKSNSETGNSRKTWIYYEKLHDIYFKNPSINAPMTLSNTGACTMQGKIIKSSGTDKGETGHDVQKPFTKIGKCSTADQCETMSKSYRTVLQDSLVENMHNDEDESGPSTEHNIPHKRLRKEAKERRHREKMEQREHFFNWIKEKDTELADGEGTSKCVIS